MSTTDRDLLEPIVSPIVAGHRLDLEDIKVSQAGRRRLIRIVVDADGGVDLDRCADLSRQVSRALDDTNAMGERPYTLEVSSPGVNRPLTLPRHWRRAAGRLVRVTLAENDTFTGRVTSATDAGATLDVDGAPRQVAFPDVRKARIQVEFRSTAKTNGESG